MIRNQSIPLRVPPYWISKDNDEEIKKNTSLREAASKLVVKKPTKFLDTPEKFIDPDIINGNLPGTTWSIEYLDFLIHTGKYQPVNSAAGRIQKILLTIFLDPTNPQDTAQQRLIYTSLVKNFGHDRSYKILCKIDQKEIIEEWFEKLDLNNVKLEYLSSVFDVTCWAQDPYVALYSPKYDRTILVESNDFNRFDDQTIACDVGAQCDEVFNFSSYLFLQGGNILCTLDHILIGKDYVVKNTGRAYLGAEKEVLESFSKLFNGMNCLTVGLPTSISAKHRTPKDPGNCVTSLSFSGIWQPVFHIDMFLTPTGIRSDENGNKEILLIGSLTETKNLLSDFSSSAEIDRFNKYCAKYAHYFDIIGKQLQRYYQVFPIPVYPEKANFSYENVTYETNYYLTYNNVVIESFEDGENTQHRNVQMPTYSLAGGEGTSDTETKSSKESRKIRNCLDGHATKIWEKIGFKVYPISNMESYTQSGGAVHCMTKILQRTNQ